MRNALDRSDTAEREQFRETNLFRQFMNNNVMDKLVDNAERKSKVYEDKIEDLTQMYSDFFTEDRRTMQLWEKQSDYEKRQEQEEQEEQEEQQNDCDSYIFLIDRKDHRVHYVSTDVFMNIALPSYQNKFENLQKPNENNPMVEGKRFFHRFHDVSWTFWSNSPLVQEIHIVERNAPNESKSNKMLVECITKTKEFQQGQKQEKHMKMNTDHVHSKYAKTSCCPQYFTTQFELRNTDACRYKNNVGRVERNSDGERIKCIGSHYPKHERAFALFRGNSLIENVDTIRKYGEDVEGYIRSRDPLLQQEMIVVENLTKDSMQTANQRLKEQLAEFVKENVQRSLYVNEKELQSSEFDDQCKDPQNLDGSEKKKSKNEKHEKYMKMDTDHVHSKYAKTSCCPEHCTTQFKSRNTVTCGYENSFERVDRNSEGERIKCKGSCYIKHKCAFETENVKITTARFKGNSSIENVDTIRKYCEDVEGYIRSRDPMLQQEMIVVENLTKDIMEIANRRLIEQLAEFDKEDLRRTLYVNEKELQSTEFDDQRNDPQNLDGSEKKKSNNEFLTVIPKILCSEEGHYKQNEHQEVSIECQLCIHRNKAVNWCDTCEKNICRFCKLYHEKVWLVMNHDIQPLRIDELICETMNFC